MKKFLVWCSVVAMGVTAGGYCVSFAAGPISGPITAQQSGPQEQAATEKPAPPQSKADPSRPPPAPAIAPFDAEQARKHQETWAKHLGVPIEMTNAIGMRLVLIPAGEFLMGSRESPEELARLFSKGEPNPELLSSEQPQHRVRITKPFYLGMHEVTVKQFRQFVEVKNYRTEAEQDGGGGYRFDASNDTFEQDEQYNWRNPGFLQSDDHPVANVSWNDAVAFCDWLSDQEEKRYSLPTEAQWEYACRGGTTTHFSNGDDPEKLTLVGNVADAAAKAKIKNWTWTVSSSDGCVFASPVGKFRANEFGLYDMHGNVCEWCADRCEEEYGGGEYYAKSPVDDPPGAATGSARLHRGGSWFFSAAFCRSAFRVRDQPTFRFSNLGFRVAAVPSITPVPPESPSPNNSP